MTEPIDRHTAHAVDDPPWNVRTVQPGKTNRVDQLKPDDPIRKLFLRFPTATTITVTFEDQTNCHYSKVWPEGSYRMSTDEGNLIVDVATKTAIASVTRWLDPPWDTTVDNLERLVRSIQDAVLEFGSDHDLDLSEVTLPSVSDAIREALK